MTTQEVVSYTPDQQAIAVASLERYGLRPTERLLDKLWGSSPHQTTLLRWRDKRADIVVTDAHRDFWADYDKAVRTQMTQRIPELFDKVAGTIEYLTDDDNVSADVRLERLAKLQGATISLGILYDKVFPQARNGANVNVSAGEGATVNLMVVAAPEQSQYRAVGDE